MRYFVLFLLTLTLMASSSVSFPAETQTGRTEKASSSAVSQVEVRGNQRVPANQILDVVTTKIEETPDPEKLKKDVQLIFDLGYFSDVKVEQVKAEQGVKVVFLVIENPVVREIKLDGSLLISAFQLRKLMKTQAEKVLNTRTLYGDVLAINEYYSNQGYTDPSNHVSDLSWSKEGVVLLKIQEGILIQKIEIAGNSVYPEAKLRQLLDTQVGRVFNRKTMEADLGKISGLYEEDSYVLAGLKGNIKPDGTVVIQITETRVESMRIEGNAKTKDYVIYRLVKTKVGDILQRKRIRKDIERLNNTGFFETVNVDPEEGTEPGKVVLVWKVKEQRTGTASFGLGYGGGGGANRSGLSGAVTVSDRNIGGTGQAASFQWERGILINSLSFGYSNPWIDKAEDSLSVSVFNSDFFSQAEFIPGTNPPQFAFFNDHRRGASITVGRPVFNEDTHAYLTFQHEFISTDNINSTVPIPSFLGPVQGTVRSLAASLVNDTRNDVFDTTQGAFYSASYARAGPPFGGSFQFNKYQGDVRQYYPFLWNSTFAFHLLGGLGRGNLPVTEWYVLGGSDTLRGYSISRFIGTRMLLGSAEIRFPLGKQQIFKAAIFADVGRAWQPTETVNIKSLASDYGLGIRMKLPNLGLGIIRLDFAFGGDGSRSVIGIGQSF